MNAHHSAYGASHVCSVLGINRTQWELHNIVKALHMCPWLNTEQDAERLSAALWALANWTAYQAECKQIRERRPPWSHVRAWRAK